MRSFDERDLVFIYQEMKKDGSQGNFFRLDNPEREDARRSIVLLVHTQQGNPSASVDRTHYLEAPQHSRVEQCIHPAASS